MRIETNGFAIGDIVRETVTGFEGTVIGITQWETGCARAQVQPKMRKDGTVPDTRGVDVLSLELVKAGPRHDIDQTKGGPRPEPSRIADARR